MAEVLRACWHSAGLSCSRQSLKPVSRLGVSRISSTAQGLQRGGTSSTPRQSASNRPASTTQRISKARKKVMPRSLSEQTQLLDLSLAVQLGQRRQTRQSEHQLLMKALCQLRSQTVIRGMQKHVRRAALFDPARHLVQPGRHKGIIGQQFGMADKTQLR